jgi:predicted nuclease of predicted toxin-antitoxin system
MSIRLYMDEHIPRAITATIRRNGVDVVTAQEDGFPGMLDRDLLDRATQLARVMVTSDTDFLIEADYRSKAEIRFSGVIFIHLMAITIGGCADDLEILAGAAEPEDLSNPVQFLPL